MRSKGRAWALAWLALGGCAPEFQGLANDPIVGGPPLRAARDAGGASAVPAGRSGAVPGLPSPSPPGNTATLASGRPLPALDPSRELKIGPGGPGSAVKTGTGAGVALEPPQPLTDAGAIRLEVPARENAALTGGRDANGYEQLKAKLTERGLLWMRLETSVEKNEVKLTCYVANPRTPNVVQPFVVEARDEVAALRAVLDKMDSGR